MNNLALFFGSGGVDIFSCLEKKYSEINFAILNYWVESPLMVDLSDSDERTKSNENVSFQTIDWIAPNPPILEIRTEQNKYNDSAPIAYPKVSSEWLLNEFKSKKVAFANSLISYREVYIIAHLDSQLSRICLIDFILAAKNSCHNLILIFPFLFSGEKIIADANKIIEILIESEVKFSVIFSHDFAERNLSVSAIAKSIDSFLINVLEKTFAGYKTTDEKIYLF